MEDFPEPLNFISDSFVLTLHPNSAKFDLKHLLQISGENNIDPIGCQDNFMKMPVLSTYLTRYRIFTYMSAMTLAILILATGTGADQNENQSERAKKVVVLDPGHGGHDMGAGKPVDIYEKEVALNFSRLLSHKLKPAYTVHLTRSDDYQIDLMHRPAVANHLKADLFLSIHTGASTLHIPSGMLIAYYDNQFRLATTAHDSQKKKDALPAWDEKSAIQVEKSKKLARLLKEKLLEYNQELKVDIRGMPIVVLEGANQPALLIEIGYLTNPTDLRKLKNNSVLESYTKTISAALDAYFSNSSDM